MDPTGPDPRAQSGVQTQSTEGEPFVTLVNQQGQPLANAFVYLSDSSSSDSQAILLTSDRSGRVQLQNTSNYKVPMITVSQRGYIRTSWTGFEHSDQLTVRAIEPQTRVFAEGETQGYGRLRTDDRIDFSIVLSPLSMEQILKFALEEVISDEMDTVRLPLGQSIEVPSNLSIPRQRERYIVPITFEKLRYRAPLSGQNRTSLYALKGSFAFSRVIDKFRGGGLSSDLVNEVNFESFGSTILTDTEFKQASISIDQEDLVEPTAPVKSPEIGDKETGLAAAIFSLPDGGFVPADIKSFKSNQSLVLKNPKDRPSYQFFAATEFRSDSLTSNRISRGAIIEGDQKPVLPRPPVALWEAGVFSVRSEIENCELQVHLLSSDINWTINSLDCQKSLALPIHTSLREFTPRAVSLSLHNSQQSVEMREIAIK